MRQLKNRAASHAGVPKINSVSNAVTLLLKRYFEILFPALELRIAVVPKRFPRNISRATLDENLKKSLLCRIIIAAVATEQKKEVRQTQLANGQSSTSSHVLC
jgi:hypothetical protein